MATALRSAPARATLPNFLPEDFLALLRAAVGIAWLGVFGMALIRIGYALAGLTWSQLGGFADTYGLILAEFALTASVLSVLAVNRTWFERVPRAASLKLRALLTLVVVWLVIHHLFVFHLLGAWRGPVLPLLPMLIVTAFVSMPRSGAWAVTVLLLAGHFVVGLLEYTHWIQSPGMFADVFAADVLPGMFVLALTPAAAVALGLLARQRLDQVGANVHRSSRVNALTGLYEQGFLVERLGSELARLRRQGGSVALLMIEFDGFATYTAERGYDAGREALQHAAQTLIRSTRHDMDTPARYAPTTFALLLPDARKEQAGEIAARVGEAMASISGGGLVVRAGMASIAGSADLTAEAVLGAAGLALRSARPGQAPAQIDLPLRD